MRSIKKIHNAAYAPIADLETHSPLPSRTLNHLDPFLFLNHHGPQVYAAPNNGLPFGPHPHRGMETVTFILEGDIMHKDNGGGESVINAGGVQWMTAGKGLIHAEVSSDDFKRNGGPLEILQLWVNLPAKDKMALPKYVGLQKEEIPSINQDDGKVVVNLISGNWNNQKTAFNTLNPITLSTIYFKPGGKISVDVPCDETVFFYIIKGNLKVNGTEIGAFNLVEFEKDDEKIEVESNGESILLFGHAKPFNEPIIAQGPFVMNTENEIRQAYEDYRLGRFGTWV